MNMIYADNDFGYFEDFKVGDKLRHSRGATIDEVENNLISKMVMNTAQAHWNEDLMEGSPMGDGRLVFGLLTASMVFGLSSQDTAEHAVRELSCTGLRFKSPVHHGDTIYAFSEVLTTSDSPDEPGCGVVEFKHLGVNQSNTVVFEGRRTVLLRKREQSAVA